MFHLIPFFCILIAFVSSIPCGEYTTECKQAGPIYVQYTYEVTVNSESVAKKILQIEKQYADNQCKKNSYLTFTTEFSTSLTQKDDEYHLTYKSVSMTVDDADQFASLGFTCNQSVQSGKSYDLSKIHCDQANLPYTTVYAESIGTTVEHVRIRSGNEVIHLMGMDAYYTGLTGCTTQITLIVVSILVVVILVLALVFVCYCRK